MALNRRAIRDNLGNDRVVRAERSFENWQSLPEETRRLSAPTPKAFERGQLGEVERDFEVAPAQVATELDEGAPVEPRGLGVLPSRLKNGGQRGTIGRHGNGVMAVRSFAKRKASTRPDLRHAKTPARMLEAAQVVKKCGHQTGVGVLRSGKPAQRALVVSLALGESTLVLRNNAEAVERPGSGEHSQGRLCLRALQRDVKRAAGATVVCQSDENVAGLKEDLMPQD